MIKILSLLVFSLGLSAQTFPFPGPGLPISGGGSTPALVSNSKCEAAAGMTCTTSPAISTVGATVNVVYYTCMNQTAVGTLTDTSGNTYTQLTEAHTSGSALSTSGNLYYVLNPITSGSETLSIVAPSSIACHVYFAAFKNTLISGAIDGTPTFTTVNGTAGTLTLPSQTPSATGYLIITGMGTLCGIGSSACSSPVVGVDSGFNLFDSDNALGTVQGGFAYKIGTTAPVAPIWTVGNSTEGMVSHMIIFKHI